MNQNNMNNMMNKNNMNNIMNQNNMNNMMNQGTNIEYMNNMANNPNNMNNMNKMLNNNNIMNIGNNLEMNNWNNNQESQNFQEEDEFLKLIFKMNFKEKDKNFELTILCKKNELFSEVIKRFCSRTMLKREYLLFSYNSILFKKDKTVQELGLLNGSVILVIDKEPIVGG